MRWSLRNAKHCNFSFANPIKTFRPVTCNQIHMVLKASNYMREIFYRITGDDREDEMDENLG